MYCQIMARSMTLSYALIDNYSLLRLDRERHGGGVLMYVRNCLSHQLIFSGSADLEIIIISIDVHPSRVALAWWTRESALSSSNLGNRLLALK